MLSAKKSFCTFLKEQQFPINGKRCFTANPKVWTAHTSFGKSILYRMLAKAVADGNIAHTDLKMREKPWHRTPCRVFQFVRIPRWNSQNNTIFWVGDILTDERSVDICSL